MKILWLCNHPFSESIVQLGHPPINTGGWMASLSEEMLKQENLDLYVVAPYSLKSAERIIIENVTHIIFPYNEIKKELPALVSELSPELIHIHGTEYDYSVSLLERYPELNYLVSIQGLLSFAGIHYTAFLSDATCYKRSLRDFIKNDSINKDRKNFLNHRITEKKIISVGKNVTGRTTWDKACVSQLAPRANYYFCNESLRSSFYEHRWNIELCTRKRIFFSQGTYPLKGLHIMLDALAIIVRTYPETVLYVGGRNIVFPKTIKGRILQTYYGKFLKKKIISLNIERNIVFTDNLNEYEMVDQLLKCNVFVSSSSIENSPNSVCEAMLMGVPIVSSYVGGVMDLLQDKVEGLLFPAQEYYILADHVLSLFEDDGLASRIGEAAHTRANITHDRENNALTMLGIYNDIINATRKEGT